jgi:putative ABC transport system permease protein
MTGIITYVSVIERTKEIGVLRAVGARKKDVGRLFEAECVFIGFGSGVFGCLVAWVATFPINGILNALYGEYNIGNIADLAIGAMIFLVVISIVLTFVSSLFPARAAAKKDPVIALRTE